jgi:hypothetical protein
MAYNLTFEYYLGFRTPANSIFQEGNCWLEVEQYKISDKTQFAALVFLGLAR